MKIGFIGLGIMGRPMAKNLMKAGYSLVVSSRRECVREEFAALGAEIGTYESIGRECGLIFTMLPNSPEVKEVMLSPGGVAETMHAGQIYVDMSSINPIASREIGAALAKKGVEMLDAPVSGGEPKAVNGTLAFMVGGRREVFEKLRPLFDCMGSSAVLVGELGAGNTAKLANQIIVACNIQALSEALTLAKKAGVDPETVFEAIRGGLAGSTVMEAKAPMMLSGNSTPGFRIDLHIKDLNNVLSCASSVGAPVPMAEGVCALLKALNAEGHGSEDHSAIVKYYEKQSGTTLHN